MSFQEEERRWKRIQELLAAEASGQAIRPLVSQRTLFGIPSEMEKRIDKIVAEDEARRRASRRESRDAGTDVNDAQEGRCDHEP